MGNCCVEYDDPDNQNILVTTKELQKK